MLHEPDELRTAVLVKGAHSLSFDDDENGWVVGEESDSNTPGLEDENNEDAPEQEDEFDNLVARYFSDVRRFSLLSRTEEKDLWQRIEDAHRRVCRALYTAPTTLHTLTRLWHQIEHAEMRLEQVLSDADATPAEHASRRAHFGETMVQLQELCDAAPQITQSLPGHLTLAIRSVTNSVSNVWRSGVSGLTGVNPCSCIQMCLRRCVWP